MENLKYKIITQDEEFKTVIDINQYDECIYNTFKYIFNKFKNGIFVHIKNQSLYKFVPFSKFNFINESAGSIIFEDKMMVNKYTLLNQNGYISDEKGFTPDFAYKMLNRCLELYQISDCTFFINLNPFPILSLHGTEPFINIWGEDVPLMSHKYSTYADILSTTSFKNFLDKPIPKCEKTIQIELPKFENKIDKAVFRGISSGYGTLIRNNPRIKILKIAKENPNILDAGIIEWKQNYRKRFGDKEYKKIQDAVITQFPTIKDLTLEEQGHYRYIINLPGYYSESRLIQLFKLDSIVLHVPNNENCLWFESILKPYIHYIPLDKDLKNLKSQIQWCKNNQEICKNIIKNMNKFYVEHLTQEKQILYLQTTLVQLNNYFSNETTSLFNYNSPEVDFIDESELIQVEDGIFKTDKYLLKKYNPYEGYNYFKYVQYLVKSYVTHTGEYKGWRKLYGKYNEYMVMDIIEPKKYITLYEYLCLNNIDFIIVQDCILQLCILLNNAYKTNKFIYNNCNLWNIMINVDYSTTNTVYIQNGDEEYIFNTHCTLYLIEYEKGIVGKQEECKDIFQLLVNIFHLILSNIYYYPQHVINLVIQLYHEIFPYSNCEFLQDIVETLAIFKNGQDYNLKLINSKIDLSNYMDIYKLLETYFQFPLVKKRKIQINVDKLFQQYISLKEF